MTMEDTWTEPAAEPVPVTPTKGARRKAEREARAAAAEALAADYLPRIRKAAGERDRAGEAYARKLAVVRTLIREANDAGVPMTEVAVAANVARSRAHGLYRKAGRPVSQGDLLRD